MLRCKVTYRFLLLSPLAQAHSVLIVPAGIIHGAAHGCLSLACLVGYGLCTLSQARVAHCAPRPLFVTLNQGGRFVLVSAAGLGLMRSCDSLTTSDLCVLSCCPNFVFVIVTPSYSRYYQREHARENWEIKNYIEGEKREMVELWTSRGLDVNTATDVIEKISMHHAFFADIMMKVSCVGFVTFYLFISAVLLLMHAFLPLPLLSLSLPSPFRTSSTFLTPTLTPSKLPSQAALALWVVPLSHRCPCSCPASRTSQCLIARP